MIAVSLSVACVLCIAVLVWRLFQMIVDLDNVMPPDLHITVDQSETVVVAYLAIKSQFGIEPSCIIDNEEEYFDFLEFLETEQSIFDDERRIYINLLDHEWYLPQVFNSGL